MANVPNALQSARPVTKVLLVSAAQWAHIWRLVEYVSPVWPIAPFVSTKPTANPVWSVISLTITTAANPVEMPAHPAKTRPSATHVQVPTSSTAKESVHLATKGVQSVPTMMYARSVLRCSTHTIITIAIFVGLL